MRPLFGTALLACYLVVAGCAQPNKKDSGMAPADLTALSSDGTYGVISGPSDDPSRTNWMIVRFLDLRQMRYEILDTLQGNVRFADFCAPDGILYACVDSPCASVLSAVIESLPQVDTLIECVGDSCNAPELNDISWAIYAPNHRILVLYCEGENELSLIRPDGALSRVFGTETDVRCQTFDADESELVFFSAYGPSDEDSAVYNYVTRVYDMDGYALSSAGMFFENVGKVVCCRGKGEPIYYLREETDLPTTNVWKYDRQRLNRFRVTDFGRNIEVLRFWLVGDSVACWVEDRTLPPPNNRRLMFTPG